MNDNRTNLLAYTVTSMISILFTLFIKSILDNVFHLNQYSTWILPISIPFFGVIRIITKDLLYNWSNHFLEIVPSLSKFNLNNIAKIAFQIFELMKIVVMIPVWAIMMIFGAGYLVVSYLFRLFIAFLVSSIVLAIIYNILLSYKIIIPGETPSNIIANVFIWIYLISLPILVFLGFYHEMFGEGSEFQKKINANAELPRDDTVDYLVIGRDRYGQEILRKVKKRI